MVLSKLYRGKDTLGRQVFTCLLLFCAILHGRSLTDEFARFLFQDRQTYGAESSAVSLRSEYTLPIYYRREDRGGDSLLSIDLYHVTNHIDAAYCREQWGSRIRIMHRYKTFELDNRVGDESSNVRSTANLLQARADLWLNYGEIGNQVGLSVGRFFPGDSISFPHMSTFYEFPFTGFADNDKSSYAFWWNMRRAAFSTELLFDRSVSLFEPMHLSKSSGNYKNLPLIQFKRRIYVKASLEKWGRHVGVWWERSKISGERIVLTNCLPFISDWTQYKIGAEAGAGDHELTFEAFTSMGACYGYEDEKPDAARYLIYDDLFMKQLRARYSFGLFEWLTLGAQGELFKGDSPDLGTVELYPFSSWSIFKPVKYRFSEALFEYRKAGINSQFSLGKKHRTTLGFDLDFHKAELQAVREQRKIVVLVPIYVDKTTINPVHHYLLSGDISVAQQFHLGKVLLELRVQQFIPFYVKSFKESDEETSNDESTTFDTKFFGGLKSSIALTIPF